MKISDYKNEAALDLLADILEPAATIFADPQFKVVVTSSNRMSAVTYVIKNHKKEIIQILARIEGVSPSEYKGTVITMTKQVLDLLNDEELVGFFSSQGLMEEKKSSIKPMENIKGRKQ